MAAPAFLFDLDGTLVDNVYQHVLDWREALDEAGIELAVWRIHPADRDERRLFVNALLWESGHRVTRGDGAPPSDASRPSLRAFSAIRSCSRTGSES